MAHKEERSALDDRSLNMPKEAIRGLEQRAETNGPVRLKADVRAGQGGYAEGIARKRRGQRGGGDGEWRMITHCDGQQGSGGSHVMAC